MIDVSALLCPQKSLSPSKVEAMSVFYLTIAGYIVVGGAGVGVFLYGKEHGNSIFDRLYRIFCMHLPRVLKKAFKGLTGWSTRCQGLEKVFGKRAPAALDAAWVYAPRPGKRSRKLGPGVLHQQPLGTALLCA